MKFLYIFLLIPLLAGCDADDNKVKSLIIKQFNPTQLVLLNSKQDTWIIHHNHQYTLVDYYLDSGNNITKLKSKTILFWDNQPTIISDKWILDAETFIQDEIINVNYTYSNFYGYFLDKHYNIWLFDVRNGKRIFNKIMDGDSSIVKSKTTIESKTTTEPKQIQPTPTLTKQPLNTKQTNIVSNTTIQTNKFFKSFDIFFNETMEK